MSKFQNCFIDESELFKYDIVIDNELFGKAHSLSAKDRSYVEQKSQRMSMSKGDEIVINIDTQERQTATILRALDSWVLDRKLSEDAINMLSQDMRNQIYSAIEAHETQITEKLEANEKN